MKKHIYYKIKLLPPWEYIRLSRLLKLRMGCGNLDCVKSVFNALEHGCKKIDAEFDFDMFESDELLGYYDQETHTIYFTPETFDTAWKGCKASLFTIVHEIAHWAMITVFKVRQQGVFLELPLCFSHEEDSELYANTFACYLMLPSSPAGGFRKIFRQKKNGDIYRMSLRKLNARRYCRATRFKKSA